MVVCSKVLTPSIQGVNRIIQGTDQALASWLQLLAAGALHLELAAHLLPDTIQLQRI